MTALTAIVQAALEETAMPERQKVVAIVLAVAMLLAVFELVRRRKLREEYSVLWILTAIALLVLAFNYRVLVFFSELIGEFLVGQLRGNRLVGQLFVVRDQFLVNGDHLFAGQRLVRRLGQDVRQFPRGYGAVGAVAEQRIGDSHRSPFATAARSVRAG